MILKLYKGQVYVKGNTSPEDITNCNVTYEYELGTNQLVPRLIINGKIFNGDNINISLEHVESPVRIIVQLLNANNIILYTYKNTFDFYRTFTIGTPEHIDIYKELVKAQARIKELEEQGEVI